MIPVTIELTDQQMNALQKQASSKNISIEELILEVLESALEKYEIRRRALDAAGKFHSDKTNVSRNHDKYLDEIYSS